MPISIPTSVAGISIPGAVNGPLNALYRNKYELKGLRYPRDLGTNPTKSHIIRFAIFEPAPSSQQPQLASNLVNITKELGRIATGDVTSPEVIKEQTSKLIESLSATDVKRVARRYIDLYIPDNLNVSYSAAYDDISLTESLGKPYFLAQVASTATDYFKNTKEMSMELANRVANDPFVRSTIANIAQNRLKTSNLPELALKQIGQALNPQLQVLFRGVGFRTFQFDFVLTPYSKEEAIQIKEIIKEFKLAAAPEIKPTAFFEQGMFLNVPDLFNIEFMYKGAINENVHKIGPSVLENINVDYAPNGWSAHNDGAPVQTRLTLQFKETIIVDKNRIREGY
jgi:hypothetical protein